VLAILRPELWRTAEWQARATGASVALR
jgi:hypothetical protein